jgi:hypothetical protein
MSCPKGRPSCSTAISKTTCRYWRAPTQMKGRLSRSYELAAYREYVGKNMGPFAEDFLKVCPASSDVEACRASEKMFRETIFAADPAMRRDTGAHRQIEGLLPPLHAHSPRRGRTSASPRISARTSASITAQNSRMSSKISCRRNPVTYPSMNSLV